MRQRLPRLGRWLAALLASGVLAAGPAQAAGQSAVACPATATGGPRVHVEVDGLHSDAGNVTVTLYGEVAGRFMAHKGWIARTRATPSGRRAEACFEVSVPGAYAVVLYHDENGNHRFDRTLIGLPAEGYGFSNDAPTPIGLPAFSAARIMIAAGENRIAVRMRY